jgi:WD40 repeat protein
MTDLFVSYARADSRDFVARLAGALEGRGKDAWVDLEDIAPASSWNDDLRAGIAGSDSFCFVISPRSVVSTHCRNELAYAVELGKRIIPVLHLPVPDGEVPEAVASRNWVPQTGRFEDAFDTALDTLVVAVETDLEWVREHTRWTLRAEEWERRGEDRSVLARGSDLEQAEAFLGGGGRDPAPTELQGRFVLASRRAATRRQRQVVGGVSVALVVAVALGVLALLQRNTAVDQRREAESQRREAEAQRAAATSRALAANAFLNLPTDPELSLLLGLEAAAASPTPEAENALRSAILESRVRVQLRRAAAVTTASYSPDGSRIVTTSADVTAALWDAASGELVAELTGHTQNPQQAQWSADGSRFATIAGDGTARVYDGTSGAEVSVITDTEEYRLTDLALSADGSVLITAAFVNGQVHFWDATDGDLLGTIPRSTVDEMALSPDNSLLLLAVQQEAVELWSTADASMVASFPEDAQEFFTDAAFSPDGSELVTAGADGYARVRAVDGAHVTDVQHNESVQAVAFSPDGRLLATASEDGTAQVTDLERSQVVATFTRSAGPLEAVAFSPDGRLVATGGEDGVVQLWQPDGGASVASLVGHRAPVNSLAFGPAGDTVLSASDDSTARVWTAAGASGSFIQAAATPVPESFEEAFSTDGTFAALVQFADDDTTTSERTLDVESGRLVGEFTLADDEIAVPAVSPDGTLAVTTTYDGPTRLRRTSDGELVAELGLSSAFDAAFDGAGRVLVVGGTGAAGIFEATTGELLVPLEGHDPAVEILGAGFSPDGTRAMTASVDGTVRVWDADTGEQQLELPAIGPPTRQYTQAATVVMGPDGDRLATAAGYENDTHLWDADTGEHLATLEGTKAGGVTDVDFSADGRFLVTSTFSGAVRLWDGRTGRPLAAVTDRATSGEAVAFVGDQQRIALVAGTGDGTQLLVVDCTVCGDVDALVELGRTRVTRDLTDTERATYLGTE